MATSAKATKRGSIARSGGKGGRVQGTPSLGLAVGTHFEKERKAVSYVMTSPLSILRENDKFSKLSRFLKSKSFLKSRFIVIFNLQTFTINSKKG